jgi:flagellar biosynthesis protein FlhG
MADQLTSLRSSLSSNFLNSYPSPSLLSGPCISIVCSGKGGVGKSVISAGLGLAASRKENCAIVDLDFQMANQEILFNGNFSHSIKDLLKSLPLQKIFSSVDTYLDVLPGVSGETQVLTHKNLLLEKIKYELYNLKEQYQQIFIDWGTGMWSELLQYIPVAKRIICITSPSPTSIKDTYALFKLISSTNQATEKWVIINKVKTQDEGMKIFEKFNIVIQKFLGIPVYYMGSIKYDKKFHESLMRNISINDIFFQSSFGRTIQSIYQQLGKTHIDPHQMEVVQNEV